MTIIEKQFMESVIAMNRRMVAGNIDWNQRRYEIAKDVLCAMLSNPGLVEGVTADGEPTWDISAPITKTAVKFADLLIEELKGGCHE